MDEKLYGNLINQLGESLKKDFSILDDFAVVFKNNYLEYTKNDMKAKKTILECVEKMEAFVNGDTEHGCPFACSAGFVGGLLSPSATNEQVLEIENELMNNVYINVEQIISSVDSVDSLDEEVFMRMYNSLHVWKDCAETFIKTTKEALNKRKATLKNNNQIKNDDKSKENIEEEDALQNSDIDYDEEDKEEKKIGLKIASGITIILVIIGILEGSILSPKGLMVCVAYLIFGVLLQRNFFSKSSKSFFDYLFFILNLPSIIFTLISFAFIGDDEDGDDKSFSDKAVEFLNKCEGYLDKKIEETNLKEDDYDFTLIDESYSERKLKFYALGLGNEKEYKDDIGNYWYTVDDGKHFYKK